MKYFSKEIWAGHNRLGPLSQDEAVTLWEKNLREYRLQLEGLRPRLDEEAYKFFSEENLHDGRLLSFSAGDALDGLKVITSTLDLHNLLETSVRMRVLNGASDELYTLKYGKVRKALFDFPTDEPLFYSEGQPIGVWGYDELTAVNDTYLRHEVLFASGTALLIEFREFSSEKTSWSIGED